MNRVRIVLVIGVWGVVVGLGARGAQAQNDETKAEVIQTVHIPTNVTDYEIKFGYAHTIRDYEGGFIVTDPGYHTVEMPAAGAASTATKDKPTPYKDGSCTSWWSLTVENGMGDVENQVVLKCHQLKSEAKAPTGTYMPEAASKEFITINGALLWVGNDKKITKIPGKIPKAKAKGKPQAKRRARAIREALKENGFKGAPALGLIDLYADYAEAAWNVIEDYVELDEIELANYTFGAIGVNSGSVAADMGEYEGFVRLEADPNDGLARIDSRLWTINEGLVFEGTASLTGGVFTPTGYFVGLPWVFEYDGVNIVGASLDLDELPGIGWEIERDDVNPDPEYWETEKAFLFQIEDLVYDATPDPTVLPCNNCGPGEYWMVDCEGGPDGIRSSDVELGVSLDGDCTPETELLFFGPLTVYRSDPSDGVIDLELVEMILTGPGNTTLITGAGLHNGPHPVQPSLGTLVQDAEMPELADAEIDVYFEIEYAPGLFGYNHDPLTLRAEGITCVPPDTDFEAVPGTCVGIYDVPAGIPDPILVGNVTLTPDDDDPSLEHDVYSDIPTVSEWGLMVMTLLLFTAGTIVIGRRRRTAA